MSFDVAAMPVSMGGIVERFNTPPTTVGAAIVMYALFVSGFIMLGAKLGRRATGRRCFSDRPCPFRLGDDRHDVQPERNRHGRGSRPGGVYGSRPCAHPGRPHRY